MRMATADIVPGTSLGKFEILRKLATGGMAEIYLARARGIVGFEKLVVIKRILSQYASDPSFVDMFLDEARLAANLHHPNIAQIYEVGADDQTYYFAMEFVHGQDVRTIKRAAHKQETRVPLPQILTILQGAAQGLHYAHEMKGPGGQPLNIVHRDVSPSNVLVSYDGAVKILDFGIAKAAFRETQTRTGSIKGKIPYMSPEQCKGQSTDRRSDLFSLGVILYELSVGRRPFRGENDFAILAAILANDLKRPRALDPSYSPALEEIVMQLLSPDVETRYQTAEDLVLDLEAFAQTEGIRLSTVELKRYMVETFADRIRAWEEAQTAGTSLEDHLLQTITGESQESIRSVTPSMVIGPGGPHLDPAPAAPSSRPSIPRWAYAAIAAVVALGVVIALVSGGNSGSEATPEAKPETTPATDKAPTPPAGDNVVEEPPPAPAVAEVPPDASTPVIEADAASEATQPASADVDAGPEAVSKSPAHQKHRPKKKHRGKKWNLDSPLLPH